MSKDVIIYQILAKLNYCNLFRGNFPVFEMRGFCRLLTVFDLGSLTLFDLGQMWSLRFDALCVRIAHTTPKPGTKVWVLQFIAIKTYSFYNYISVVFSIILYTDILMYIRPYKLIFRFVASISVRVHPQPLHDENVLLAVE